MEKRVQLEMRTMKPDQIEELILDNCRSTTIVGITDDFINLETLSLINVGLTSLKGFPKLPNLKKLELSDNRISGGLNLLHTSPKLSHLNLSGNKIASLEALEPLKEFKHLKSLDLFNNEATQISNYRELIFDLIPSLKFLDGFDAEDKEAEDSEAEDEEVNGNEEEGDSEEGEDEDDEGLEDEEEDLDDDDEVGLDAVYKDNLDEESDGEDYDGEAGEEEDDDVLDEEEEEGEDGAEDGGEDGADADGVEDDEEADAAAEEASQSRGKKRKHEDEVKLD